MSEVRVTLDPAPAGALGEQLVAIWVDVTRAGGAVGFVPPVAADDVRPVAEAAFERVGAGVDHLAVARTGDTAIGFGFLTRRNGALFEHIGVIRRLQVHPDHQGHGIGGKLLEALTDRAREIGLELLHLTVRGGTGREAFYLRHGFELAARLPGYIKLADGELRDELHLLRTL